jgi:hypothetical protein
VNETEDQQRIDLENTCDSLVNMLVTEHAAQRENGRMIAPSTSRKNDNGGNKKSYFNPALRYNSFMDREVDYFQNVVEEQGIENDPRYGPDEVRYGSQSPYNKLLTQKKLIIYLLAHLCFCNFSYSCFLS